MQLRDETRDALIASIKRFFLEELEQDIGDLKAMAVLDFCLQEIAPAAYNQAVADAQTLIQQRVGDLGGELYEPEHRYWKRDGKGSARE